MNQMIPYKRIRRFKMGVGLLPAAVLPLMPSNLQAANEVYAAQVFADSPVAYYQFDEVAGTTAGDSAGHPTGPFDGTHVGSMTPDAPSAAPNLGSALDFTGGYLEVPVIGSFPECTVEFWLQLDVLAGGCCTSIMSAGTWSTNALHFNLKSGLDIEFAVNGSGNRNTSPNTIMADGITWYHVVVTNEANSTIFYINGEMVSDNGDHTASTIDLGNSNFQIGAWNGGRLLDGRLDEVAIYDSVLSAERVLAHFEAATAAAGPDTDGDGLPNEWETDNGLDPDDDGSVNESAAGLKDGPNGPDGDPDGDLLKNIDEFIRGTDPQDDDSDDDGLLDGEELDTYGTDPGEEDSDGDGLGDGDEVNTHGTNPARADSDGDDLDDGEELDTHGTDPADDDSDDDGFKDGFEVNTLQSDPLDPEDPPLAGSVDTFYAQTVMADGPLAYYRFEENSGTIVADSSASGRHGTYTGNITLGAPSFHANLGSAADLAGGYIEIPNTGSFAESTAEVWIQLDALAGGCCTSIASAGTWTTNALHWNLKSDLVFEHAVNGQGNVNTAPNSFVADGETWYHLVVTSGGGTTIWYVNGVAVDDNGDHTGPVIDYGNSNFQIGAWNGGRLLDGRIDEFAIYDKVLTPEQVLAHYEAATTEGPLLFPLHLAHDRDTGTLSISWESRDGRLYNLRSETDPATGEPESWPIFDGREDLAATPPTNTVTIPLPADSKRFFVVEEFPAPPVSIFSDDLESGPGEWTTGSDGLEGTAWELGSPANVGPDAANSPTNCFATNLDSDYAVDANVWLRSPVIDLTSAAGATLHYAQFHDIEEGFDSGAVRILNATDNSELAVLDGEVDGFTLDWESVSTRIPASALGQLIKIEFRLDSDDLENFAGWYLDDIEVTVP